MHINILILKEKFWKLPIITVLLTFVCNVLLRAMSAIYSYKTGNPHYFLSDFAAKWLLFLYILSVISILFFSIKIIEKNEIRVANLKVLFHGCCFSIILAFYSDAFFIYTVTKNRLGYTFYELLSKYLSQERWFYITLFACSLVIYLVKNAYSESLQVKSSTTGNFGSARWASKKDLEEMRAYDANTGPMIGLDEKNNLIYVPLLNKLTISPAGGGKTTTSSIPILLTHTGPVFVFDVKGELWATTARYRSETLGRQVVVIDPFGVTRTKDFSKGKPGHLLKKYHLNPFDWIPEDQKARDRMINSFAASLVINEGGYINHFDENAKILIRGYTDYLMNQDRSQRFLPALYQLMSESIEEAQLTFDQMSQLQGRAGAAANQINRVGSDERGSILSTSYRQIDWMGDSNIQETLSESNFDLRDFIKGNMDIFVVLPEDQVKEHSRLFRMIMCLLMSLIVQADPSDLPKEKMLFLMEEIAQLGASPDIEQCIEVLRARKVVVWTVFQVLKQIEMFSKPDLFKTVPLKQIFTNDDPDTMKWVQTIGGDKTILTKTMSINAGDSHQKMQTFGGTVSHGEGESIHETGVKLIQTNEISVMPNDMQFVFLQGREPIRCKKVRYFEHAYFSGKYDENPLETNKN